MYLAPLNYDRYFKKVFSDLSIAKRFLEDFLDVEIQDIEFLPTKKLVTDDSQAVEFDFRCKLPDGNVIIEMQQWYKPDVVQRFYVYHALSAALQLEALPKKIIPLPENKSREVKDYSELLPTITIIWMVHDNLKFTEDTVTYSLTPEYVTDFIIESEPWADKNYTLINEKREYLLKLLEKTDKNIDFLRKSKLIYAFQKNIVKNGNHKKYHNWFELAEKTLKKISDKFEYDKYLKDEIFSIVIRRLKKHLEESGSVQYIQEYDEYVKGVQRFESSIAKNYEKELFITKAREEEAKRREEEAKAREEEERRQKEEERRQKEEAKAREREKSIKYAKLLIKTEATVDEIITETGLSKEEIEKLRKEARN